jgi:hypothetical protein
VHPGEKALELAAEDSLLEGADGLAFGDRTTLYVTSVMTGTLLRLQLGLYGQSRKIDHSSSHAHWDRPDGMRAVGSQRLLLAENSGKLSIVTFEGPGFQNRVIKTIKEELESTPAVTATAAWHGLSKGS